MGGQIYCADPSPLLSQNVLGASASASGWSYSAVGSVVVAHCWEVCEREGREATLLMFPLAPSIGPRVGKVAVLVLEDILEQLLRH